MSMFIKKQNCGYFQSAKNELNAGVAINFTSKNVSRNNNTAFLEIWKWVTTTQTAVFTDTKLVRNGIKIQEAHKKMLQPDDKTIIRDGKWYCIFGNGQDEK